MWKYRKKKENFLLLHSQFHDTTDQPSAKREQQQQQGEDREATTPFQKFQWGRDHCPLGAGMSFFSQALHFKIKGITVSSVSACLISSSTWPHPIFLEQRRKRTVEEQAPLKRRRTQYDSISDTSGSDLTMFILWVEIFSTDLRYWDSSGRTFRASRVWV